MDLNMESIMGASFGETNNNIRATFKKTINVRQYESEIIELEATVDMGDTNLLGAERMLVSAILQAQLEYTAYCNLVYKGLVTSSELSARKDQLISGVQAIKSKAEEVLGKPMDKYIKDIELGE